MSCLYVTPDLFLSSRVCSLARDHGLDVKVVASIEAAGQRLADDEITLVILDLTMVGDDVAHAVADLKRNTPNLRIVAYGPHVDHELLTAAQEAGCDNVMPKSQFDQQIVTLIQSHLGDQDV